MVILHDTTRLGILDVAHLPIPEEAADKPRVTRWIPRGNTIESNGIIVIHYDACQVGIVTIHQMKRPMYFPIIPNLIWRSGRTIHSTYSQHA